VDASVVSEPTASPDETSTSNGPAKLISPAPARRRCAPRFHPGFPRPPAEDHRIGFDGIGKTRRRRNEGDSLMSS
jgi:hypothetical protein